MKTLVISATSSSDIIADKIKEAMDFTYLTKEQVKERGIYSITEKAFKEMEALIFISSTGIAVRAISKFLKDKTKDPAVVVIDSSGRYVISLLSGHLGGANQLTLKLAKLLNAMPIITTATDNLNIDAPDMVAKENNLGIDSMVQAKKIASLLIEGKKVGFIDEENKIICPKGYSNDLNDLSGLVYVTNKKDLILEYRNITLLKLVRKNVVLGIGCRKNYAKEEMLRTIKAELKKQNIDERAVELIATVALKEKEEAIIEAVKYFHCSFNVFSIEEIQGIEEDFQGSDFVKKAIGVKSVCEPVVALAGANIIVKKQKLNGMTLCIGVYSSLV